MQPCTMPHLHTTSSQRTSLQAFVAPLRNPQAVRRCCRCRCQNSASSPAAEVQRRSILVATLALTLAPRAGEQLSSRGGVLPSDHTAPSDRLALLKRAPAVRPCSELLLAGLETRLTASDGRCASIPCQKLIVLHQLQERAVCPCSASFDSRRR